MKKNILLLTVGAVLLGIGLYAATASRIPQEESQKPSATEQSVRTDLPEVTFVLDTQENISTYSGVRAENAYDALVRVAQDEGLVLETKEYDFGVFVESIAGFTNTEERAWIYFVNGKAGEVAADTSMLEDGDSVEWKYTKPMY